MNIKTLSGNVVVEPTPVVRGGWSREQGIRHSISYDRVMPKLETVLTPMELSYLMKELNGSTRSFRDSKPGRISRFYENGASLWHHEDGWFHGEGDGSPYWSSHGLGYVVSQKSKVPSEFSGRFVISRIGEIDLFSGETLPDYDHALILSDIEVRRMHGYIQEWDVRLNTGLAVPIGGRQNDGELGKINLEQLMKPFQPIVVGADNIYNIDYGNRDSRLTSHDLITTSDPRNKCGVWLSCSD